MRRSDKERAQRARTGKESPYAPDRIYYRLGICRIRGQSRYVIQKIRESLNGEIILWLKISGNCDQYVDVPLVCGGVLNRAANL